eukprot:364596-Chlamydomonas_euryale.AAC.4
MCVGLLSAPTPASHRLYTNARLSPPLHQRPPLTASAPTPARQQQNVLAQQSMFCDEQTNHSAGTPQLDAPPSNHQRSPYTSTTTRKVRRPPWEWCGTQPLMAARTEPAIVRGMEGWSRTYVLKVRAPAALVDQEGSRASEASDQPRHFKRADGERRRGSRGGSARRVLCAPLADARAPPAGRRGTSKGSACVAAAATAANEQRPGRRGGGCRWQCPAERRARRGRCRRQSAAAVGATAGRGARAWRAKRGGGTSRRGRGSVVAVGRAVGPA